jgi:hypothetical protein
VLVVRSATSRAHFVNLRENPGPGAPARCAGQLSAILEFIHKRRGSKRSKMLSIQKNRWAKAFRGGNIGEGVPLPEMHLH